MWFGADLKLNIHTTSMGRQFVITYQGEITPKPGKPAQKSYAVIDSSTSKPTREEKRRSCE